MKMITISTKAMLIIDISVLILYVYFLIAGWKKGFLLQIITTIGTFVALFLSWRYCDIVAKRFQILPVSCAPFQDTIFKDAAYVFCNQIVSFIVLFLLLKLLFYFLEKLVAGIQEIPFLKQISGLLGSILGVVGATIWVMIFCVLLNLPLFANGNETINKTLLGSVNKLVVNISKEYGGPLDSTAFFNELYKSSKDMSAKDRDALEKWLDENGFHELHTDTEGFKWGEEK